MGKIYDTIEKKRILYCGPGPLKKALPTDTGYDLAAKVEKDTIIPRPSGERLWRLLENIK